MTIAAHALVVGGTGMLSGLCLRLAEDGWGVCVLARNASAFAARTKRDNLAGFNCDYTDAPALDRALDDILERASTVRLVAAWIHPTAPDAARRIGARFARPGATLRFVHVLGSAVADPARPERLEALRERVAAGLALDYAQAVLGFVVEGGGSRWLTDSEISAGVYDAALSARGLSIVGTVEPWSARP
jgi:hypothetical protein